MCTKFRFKYIHTHTQTSRPCSAGFEGEFNYCANKVGSIAARLIFIFSYFSARHTTNRYRCPRIKRFAAAVLHVMFKEYFWLNTYRYYTYKRRKAYRISILLKRVQKRDRELTTVVLYYLTNSSNTEESTRSIGAIKMQRSIIVITKIKIINHTQWSYRQAARSLAIIYSSRAFHIYKIHFISSLFKCKWKVLLKAF